MGTPPPAIEVAGLVRDFDALRALDNVSFQVPRGEIVALLGHNGAGKTTLLRVLNGLLRPTQGSVRTLGMDPTTDGQSIRARTGVLTEYPALDDFLTVRENLEAYGALYDVDPDVVRERGPRLLAALDLEDRTHTATRDLSAGLKQRAALARAMLHAPELLLLDEPTSNLDPLAARKVRDLVANESRHRGTTVLVSTHNLAEASAIADRIVVLQRGRVLASGSVSELGDHGARPHVAITTSEATFDLATTVAGRLTGDLEPHQTPPSFSVPTAGVSIADLVTSLVAAGVQVNAVVPQRASLEDVYVALHAAQDDATRPQEVPA